jgi:hypothetical protein
MLRPQASRSFLLLLAVFSASLSGLAESAAHAEHNQWTHCRHTQQRIERGKPCPCGCNRKQKRSLRIVQDLSSCAADDVVAHAPAFTQLQAVLQSFELDTPTLLSLHYHTNFSLVDLLQEGALIKPG